MYRAEKKVYMRKRHKIEERINLILCLILLFVVLPIFITTFFQRLRVEDLLSSKPDMTVSEIETELPQIVAKQISIHMPEEAIKAQIVIARTSLLSEKENGEAAPTGFTIAELQELWGNEFESYYEKLQSLTAATQGETLQYNGTYIYAPYHQASAGNTRSMAEYYSDSQMPYLSGTACHEDTMSDGYLNVFFWTKEEFAALCKNYFPEAEIVDGSNIKIVNRDSAGYVLEVMVGQTAYEGETFRNKLSLPSACFEITLLDEDVRIVTMGQGHGFGLSQYTAIQMAEEGKSYQEILEYFFKNAVLAKQ